MLMLTYRREVLAGLDCVVADVPGAHPEWAVILMHGYGATGEDLVPLAEELAVRDPSLTGPVRFIFPAAPLEPPEMADFGGRAWWPLDIGALQLAIMQGRFRERTRQKPDHLDAAAAAVTGLVEQLASDMHIPLSRIVLGGFSQGAMLATDVSLRLATAPAGLIIWSGALLCESEWRSCAEQRAGLPVWQSHGRLDPILPFEAAEWLRDLLVGAGMQVNFTAFDGPHTIPPTALAGTADFLAGLIRAV